MHWYSTVVFPTVVRLIRNTRDDLMEQTFISSEMHRCFLIKFMHWYSTVVFPTVVRMPTLTRCYNYTLLQLRDDGAEYRVCGFPTFLK
jgi:hypothetical protein